jgi:hypothetical protein
VLPTSCATDAERLRRFELELAGVLDPNQTSWIVTMFRWLRAEAA